MDRATREIKIKALPCRKADLVRQACIDLLVSENTQSITFDNGKEFAQHQSIAEALDLNNRSRKILGFRTPLEVKSTFGRVALRC